MDLIRLLYIEGTVIPRAWGNDFAKVITPADHKAGQTYSYYTSWSTDERWAVWFGSRNGAGGVVLKIQVPKELLIDGVKKESEFLIKGSIENISSYRFITSGDVNYVEKWRGIK